MHFLYILLGGILWLAWKSLKFWHRSKCYHKFQLAWIQNDDTKVKRTVWPTNLNEFRHTHCEEYHSVPTVYGRVRQSDAWLAADYQFSFLDHPAEKQFQWSPDPLEKLATSRRGFTMISNCGFFPKKKKKNKYGYPPLQKFYTINCKTGSN